MSLSFAPRGLLALAAILYVVSLSLLRADGPNDNQPGKVRQVPPPGIELSREVRAELLADVERQRKRLLELAHPALPPSEQRKRELCEVLSRGVRMTVDTNMFYRDDEVAAAQELLKLGAERLEKLDAGASELELLGATLPAGESSLSKPLPIVGGYRSRIDNSVQPFGLVLPSGWRPDSQEPMRLDVWLHGRGEKLSEVAFLRQHSRSVGEITPGNTLVLHPYGRYCNAFKFAGEIDVIEAIERVKQIFPIDESRITIRGFSMGGAGCWQLAVHYPNLWAAASPGAGFSETTEFLRVFQHEEIHPTNFQQLLLHWYDCPDWTNNLRAVPTVAYSGEKDRQKQAADVMEAAFAARGMKLPHVIGPDAEHSIHADSKIEIEQFLSDALQDGKPRLPRKVDLTTYMLRYHELGWLSIEGLEEHWQESRVQGEWFEADNRIELTTKGVTHLKLQFPEVENDAADTTAVDAPQEPIAELRIDGQVLQVASDWPNAGQPLRLLKDSGGEWGLDHSTEFELATAMRKRPGLQGPIDDAFMDAFNMMPSSPPKASDAKKTPVDEWATAEFRHAASEWQRQFRGDPPVSDFEGGAPVELQKNVVLFGTPSTNLILASWIDKLPVEWDDEKLFVNGKSYSAKTHVLAMIYPMPLAPQSYVVINSGFTFREYAQLNNARQVPMLPDWAVIDVTDGATSELPGKIVDAGFFDEHWQFK
ncbi:MAG: prolyl oligopeptidase family serine peptidase [Pirellulaceae bacterium]|jgi:dienelactone hydrolase|nr:prolyl oligopeptidase family serine peptidase [Pirellulaceae bacterium]